MSTTNRFDALSSPALEFQDSFTPRPLSPRPATANPHPRQRHRAGKKKKRRSRRKSFHISAQEANDSGASVLNGDGGERHAHEHRHSNLYSLGRNLSNTSLESQSLFNDHRGQKPMRRRQSIHHASHGNLAFSSHSNHGPRVSIDDEQEETAPLLRRGTDDRVPTAYGSRGSRGSPRPPSTRSSHLQAFPDVNFPASHPGSPMLGASSDPLVLSLGDVMIMDDGDMESRDGSARGSIDDTNTGRTLLDPEDRLEGDVCFPASDADEMMGQGHVSDPRAYPRRRRRRKWPDLGILEEWSRYESRGGGKRAMRITEPQLINGRLRPVRKGWYRAEEDAPFRFTYFNEEFPSTIHSQTISELLQEGGSFRELFRPDPRILSDDESEDEEEDEPCASLRHAPVPGADGDSKLPTRQASFTIPSEKAGSTGGSPQLQPEKAPSTTTVLPTIKTPTPPPEEALEEANAQKAPQPKQPRYGDRPVWWLDVLCPTETEMKVISKAFGIHPLTAEDIMMQEAREKVELFRNYYFVNYRTFDQDVNSENYLEPVDMYVVVFRDGLLTFHFNMTPHAANVRRRIRQLKDYLILSADWISYAIIDDITDVFGPLIQNIEDEVDEIDEVILRLHEEDDGKTVDEKQDKGRLKTIFPKGPTPGRPASIASSSTSSTNTLGAAGGDMLRKVGNCRKRVMSLYRLLGNKADVIKGFAKRCNERWEVAPRSEIGLYLGDIQDHIVTMTGNLGHYEKILARSHQNYLAQINIRMTARQEQTADVLGKLTVLGTIVLPMNIITGLWGMNVWVPGQDHESNLTWFWCITAGLIAFGAGCYMIAKRVYGIV